MEPHPRDGHDMPPRWAPRVAFEIELRHSDEAAPTSFVDVLGGRSSQRELESIAVEDLEPLFWHAFRTRATNGSTWQGRSAPSAGGLHPIEVFLVAANAESAFHYDPVRHVLGRIAVDAVQIAQGAHPLRALLPESNGAIVLLAGDLSRVEARYENPDSLLWRDAGSLIAVLQLVATWLGLGSCPLGLLGESLAAVLAPELVAVGTFAVGRIREPRAAR